MANTGIIILLMCCGALALSTIVYIILWFLNKLCDATDVVPKFLLGKSCPLQPTVPNPNEGGAPAPTPSGGAPPNYNRGLNYGLSPTPPPSPQTSPSPGARPVCGITWSPGLCVASSGSCGAGIQTDLGVPMAPLAGTTCSDPPDSALRRTQPCNIPCNTDCHVNWNGVFTSCNPSCGGPGTQSETGVVDVAQTGSGRTCKQVYPNLEGANDNPAYWTSVRRTVACTTPACPTTTKTWNISGSGVGATASASNYITTPSDVTTFQTFTLTATIIGTNLTGVSLAYGKSKQAYNSKLGNVYTWNVAPSWLNASSRQFYIYASPSISSINWTITSTYV